MKRVLIFSTLLLALASGCRRDESKAEKRTPICREVLVAAQCIVDCLGGATNGISVIRIDARKLDCNGMFKTLAKVPDSAILWMPGEFDWLVTWRNDGGRNSVADMVDRFSAMDNAEELLRDGCDSIPAVLASYVSPIRDIMPAFARLQPTDSAVPELFVTRDQPTLDPFDFAGLDEDVVARMKTELRTCQNARRMILEGCIASRGGEIEEAVGKWARAVRLHPGDTMLLERLSHLRTNGEVFYKFGKYAMAMRCYDTMAQMRPNDPVPVFNYGVCAEKMGEKKIAEAAFERSRKLAAVKEGKGK